MNAHDKRAARLRLAYEAFNRRDIETVLSLLDPEVEWPNLLDRTTLHGHDAVREYWNRQFREINPHVAPIEFLPRGDKVIVAVHQVVRDREGNVLSDSQIAHAYTFRGELVLAMEVHPSIEDAKR